jgi:hypothetical protein
MRLMIIFSLCILGLSISPAVHAQNIGSAYGTFDVTHSKMVFTYQPDSNAFLLTSAKTRVTGKSVGLGVLIDLTAPHFDETYKQIIGKDLKGKVLIQLETMDQSPALQIRITIDDSIRDYPLKGETSFTMPIEITQGTWQDYLNGKTIEAVTTDEANALYGVSITQAFSALIQTAFAGGYEGNPVAVGPVEVDLVQPIRLSINRNKITVNEIDTEHELTLTLPY